jgi:hypothetical protein
VVTAEEHSVVGGLGGAVVEALAGAWPVPVERVGVDDTFATTGPYLALLEHMGLTTAAVVAAAHRAIAHKPGHVAVETAGGRGRNRREPIAAGNDPTGPLRSPAV